MATPTALTPLSPSDRAACTASAAATKIFLGMHPRRAHVPPNGCESITATVHPLARHVDAGFDAIPVPITTRSNCRSIAPSSASLLGRGERLHAPGTLAGPCVLLGAN